VCGRHRNPGLAPNNIVCVTTGAFERMMTKRIVELAGADRNPDTSR